MKNLAENGGNVSKAMKDAGYSKQTAKTPQKLTESKSFVEMLNEMGLDDASIARKHQELLNSQRMDHMTFPLGPAEEGKKKKLPDDEIKEADLPEEFQERTTLTDQEIKEMLATVNCTVRRIVHGNTARHVYFWSADNKARKDALDMAYKLKGHYAPEKKHLTGGLSLSALFNEAANDDKDDDK